MQGSGEEEKDGEGRKVNISQQTHFSIRVQYPVPSLKSGNQYEQMQKGSMYI